MNRRITGILAGTALAATLTLTNATSASAASDTPPPTIAGQACPAKWKKHWWQGPEKTWLLQKDVKWSYCKYVNQMSWRTVTVQKIYRGL